VTRRRLPPGAALAPPEQELLVTTPGRSAGPREQLEAEGQLELPLDTEPRS